MTHDIVIRNGTVYDGTGTPPVKADIAIDHGKITIVGIVTEDGNTEIDASDRIVTPGFVDIHTHFDGQVTWDPFLQPSTCHGVTTVVMGNCGVGFAPCAPDKRDWLIGLMEGVEDIPGTALAEGINWKWETFPEFMNAIEASPLAIDVGLQVPHGAVRGYVMGERATNLEAATDEDTEKMAGIVREAIEAGALGFSTSRTEKHRDKDGRNTPSLKAEALELHGIARAIGETDKGVIQLISDFWDFEPEFELIRGMAEASGRPLSLTIEQDDRYPDIWRKVLDGISDANNDGIDMKGQVPPRPTGLLLGLTATLNPFILHQTYREIAHASHDEKLRKLQDPEFRSRLLAETHDLDPDNVLIHFIVSAFHKMFPLGEHPNYEPAPETSVAALSEEQGRSPHEVLLDLMLERDGHALLYFPLMNYLNGDLEDVRTMMTHEHTLLGLSDAGAHVGIISDVSFPTTTLMHWGRDRTRGEKLPLEWLIAGLTSKTAGQVGLLDRGILKPGYRADLNIIDFNRMKLHAPEIVYDLPAGGKRLFQKADGYDVTIFNGQVSFRNGKPVTTDPETLQGKLIRGAQPAPMMA